ncbi:MAG: ABC transporter ATP-binding protein [Thermodesulfobacteriota bacterium]
MVPNPSAHTIFSDLFFFPSATKRRIIALLGITIAATFFEGFGVAMLYPIMDFIEKGKNFEVLSQSSRMWTFIGKTFGILHIPATLISLMAIVFLLLLVRQAFLYYKRVYSKWMAESILADIRSRGFKWFVRADISFYDSHGVGQLINAMTVDGVRAGGGIFTFFNLLAAALVFALYIVFLLLLSWGMTLFALAIMGTVGWILRSRISKSREVGVEISKYNDGISSAIVERLNGIRLLKLSATEERENEHIRVLSDKIRDYSYELGKIAGFMELTVDPMVILAGLVTLYFSTEVFRLSLAEMGIFLFVLLRLMPYTKEILSSRQALAGVAGSFSRLRGLLEEAQAARVIQGGEVTSVVLRKGIRFDGVWFAYDGNNGFVLKGIDAFLPAGKMTALVGRSGAGKSTFADLIPRLRIPTRGAIFWDDVDAERFDLSSLRKSIAFVSQEGFLFNDTIRNNIRYCRPEATGEEVIAAARLAYADRFVSELPEGYETVAGEKGVKLSGGQRQRIILARALLQKASVIILDEPTSALDSESEQFIQQAVAEIRKSREITMIIIAHRLSTIRSADQIIVLDRGEIVERGRHTDLIHEDSWYADMTRIQTVG